MMETATPTPVMLITANVGSIFDDPQVLLKTWVKKFLATVNKLQPKFIALHCQEVGGKNYEDSMRHVEDFVRTLMACEELIEFDHNRVFLDEDFMCTEKFTALGSLYFVHRSQQDIHIWNFCDKHFVPVIGKEVHSGNIEEVPIKEKEKFPQKFFPECKWSRKGFMRTRWLINGTIIDLVNIHLFHDASNFVSIDTFPSVYTNNRHTAFNYTLEKLEAENKDQIPYFIFGDFNFRLDTQAVINKLTNSSAPINIKSSKNGEIVKMLFVDANNENKVMLALEKKVFDFANEETFYQIDNNRWLLDYDKELDSFLGRLFEFDINFPPSYPFKEDSSGSKSYMKTRCPAWCDRILMSCSAKKLIANDHIRYEMMGSDESMGDHKPILLFFNLMPIKDCDEHDICGEPECNHNEHINHNHYHMRTYSIPTSCNKSQHKPARRATSAFTSTYAPVIHSNEWYLKTQELFRALREKPLSSQNLTSSRLMSHHSSSSEEWYSDFKKVDLSMIDDNSSLDSSLNNVESIEKTLNSSSLNSASNNLLLQNESQLNSDDNCLHVDANCDVNVKVIETNQQNSKLTHESNSIAESQVNQSKQTENNGCKCCPKCSECQIT